MSTPAKSSTSLKHNNHPNWMHRLIELNPFSWNNGPSVALPYLRSYTDQDEDGTMERWETVYMMFRRTNYRYDEPRAYFWRYDGRKRLVVNLPFRFFFCAGFDYTDIFLPNAMMSDAPSGSTAFTTPPHA